MRTVRAVEIVETVTQVLFLIFSLLYALKTESMLIFTEHFSNRRVLFMLISISYCSHRLEEEYVDWMDLMRPGLWRHLGRAVKSERSRSLDPQNHAFYKPIPAVDHHQMSLVSCVGKVYEGHKCLSQNGSIDQLTLLSSTFCNSGTFCPLVYCSLVMTMNPSQITEDRARSL